MKLACNAQRAAAVAYNQVLKGMTSKTNRFIAAAIEGDETQHYVVLVALIEVLVKPTAWAAQRVSRQSPIRTSLT